MLRRRRPAATEAERARARRRAGRDWAVNIASLATLAAVAAIVARDRGRPPVPAEHLPPPTWREVIGRAWTEFNDDNVPLLAAGVTFYSLLALFPALAALVSLYGLFADVADAQDQLRALAGVLPRDVIAFIGEQMIRLAAGNPGGLSLALATSLVVSIWSANGAVKAIILGLNIAYDEREQRGFIKLTLTSMAFTLGALGLGLVLLAGAVVAPLTARFFGSEVETLVDLVRWPVLAAGLWFGVTLIYRYGPSRARPRWRWVTGGAAAVTLAWIGCSLLFSFYLSTFAHFDRTYGPLGAAVGFLMWTYLSAILVLGGAELNAEMERRTPRPREHRPLHERA